MYVDLQSRYQELVVEKKLDNYEYLEVYRSKLALFAASV